VFVECLYERFIPGRRAKTTTFLAASAENREVQDLVSSGFVKSLDTLPREWLVMANVLQLEVHFPHENHHVMVNI